MTLVHPLRRYRKRHKMTQEQMASALGATKSLVSKWERGAVPRRQYCERILALTVGEVTPSHFVFAPPSDEMRRAG